MHVTWHNYGYGICTDSLSTDANNLRDLLGFAPVIKEEISEYLSCGNYEEATLEDILDAWENCGGSDGADDVLGTILRGVIEEAGEIAVWHVADDDGSNYIIVPKLFPWELTENMRKWQSEDDICGIFRKYIAVITDQSFDVFGYGYQEVEGSG